MIVTHDMALIPAFRLELGEANIYYQLNDADTAAIHRISKGEVMMVRYADGRSFDPNASAEASKSYGTVTCHLEGRSAVRLLSSNMRPPRNGKVVVKVWVDREGKVAKVFAPAYGSTLTDKPIVSQLKLLAHQALFSPDPDAPEMQIGDVVYSF